MRESKRSKNVWEKMFFLWERLNVPEVRSRSFQIGWYTKDSPWFSLLKNQQDISFNKSIRLTANHLMEFQKKDSQLLAAFKIFSFLKDNYSPTPLTPVLYNVFSNFEVDPGSLWYSSTKWVLPHTKNEYEYKYQIEIDRGEWIETTLEAAKVWISIAEEWEIIVLPKYTDIDSELNKKFFEFNERWHEDPEFQKYIQLRLKYGKEDK